MRFLALDETLFQLSAAHQSSGFPRSFFDDEFARATTRLYGTLLAPAMWLFAGDVALRIDKVVSALAFCSAALPAALLARPVLRSRRTAVVAGIAAVAVPWAGLSTALFSESLAYPVFLWLALAVVRALRAPGLRTELVVLGAFVVALFARLQLVFAAPGWVVAVLVVAALAPGARGVRPTLRRAVRMAPVTGALLALGAFVLVGLLAAGRFHDAVQKVTGEYASSFFRDALPVDSGLGGLVQVQLIGLGVGLLSAIVAVAWYARVLSTRDVDPAARRFAVTTLALSLSLFALTIFAQNGYVGGITEERYYFYAVPFVWIAALAAWERRPAVSPRELIAAGVPFVLIMATLSPPRTLGPETGFLAPVSTHVDRLVSMGIGLFRDWTGIVALSERDVLWPLALIALVALALAWRSRRGGAIALGVAGAFQAGLLLYVLATSSGLMGAGLGDRTAGASFAAMGWVDRAAPGDVRWLEADPRLDAAQDQTLRLRTPFFNDRLRSRLTVAGLPAPQALVAMDRLPLISASVADDGALSAAAAPTIQWRDSPLAQLSGRVLSRSPDGLLELRAPGRQLQYLATGLPVDGTIAAGQTSQLSAWGPRGGRLELVFGPPPGVAPGAQGRVALRADRGSQTLRLPTGLAGPTATVPLCGGRASVQLTARQAQLAPDGRRLAAVLLAARVLPGGGDCG